MTARSLLGGEPLELEATVERVIFHNEENGYTVLSIHVHRPGDKAPLAEKAVGHMLSPKGGTRLTLRGQYVENRKFGRQFVFDQADEVMPATQESIIEYLASGLIKGVGPNVATRIVRQFGLGTFDILDQEPGRLLEVPGIGKKSLEKIIASWAKHRGMRALLLFLQPHGVTTPYAVRIYQTYGPASLQKVRENPYCLARDIRGIGFVTADSIAGKLGFPEDHPHRIQAAILYILQRAGDDGHVYLPLDVLLDRVTNQIGVSPELIHAGLQALELAECIVREELGCADGAGIYLKRYHHCETRISWYLQRLLAAPKSVTFRDAADTVAQVVDELPITLAPAQLAAVQASARAKAMVITGGPGTGKTTIINAIIQIFATVGARILLAAPTGRAAKRMAEATGRDARTIHRLLEYSPQDDKFTRNEDCPLACGLLVIDEASMIDTTLFYHLLKAIPLGATVILVGDAHQLPSVGPGNVLGDVIASGVVPVAELNEIFRQSSESEIICNAHLIHRGQMPVLERSSDRLSDFYFIASNDPEESAQLIVDLIKFHIPRRFGLDPVNDVQLLTPMHKGAVGAENMNSRLQEALNPHGLQVKRGERAFRLHDKVMQVRNNYDKDIYNGDIGHIASIDPKTKKLWVDFDFARLPYEFDELDELVPAYAISIHKSQGSEYPAVVIPLMMQHYIMLQRNLIYTAVTRGKKLVVLVGEQKALAIAIRNNQTGKRYTWLAQRLAALPVRSFSLSS